MRILLKKILWCFLFIVGLWLGGMQWFAMQIPTYYQTNIKKADAIVVLTGGKNRLEYGMELLASGHSEKLFISGVHEDITEEQLVKLIPSDLRKKVTNLDKNAITIGRKAWNTIGNAEETKHWLEEQKVTNILLVTSNYHMPRSYYEFRHLVKGVTITSTPVPTDDFNIATWWTDDHYRTLIFLEYHKYIASMIRNALIPLLNQQ